MITKTKRTGIADIEKQFGNLTFGRLLKSHRLGEELTQVEMAEQLRISKQNLNDLEHERKIPSIRRAVDIARKIGIMEDLMVQLVLQAYVNREKLNYQVHIRKGVHAS